MAPNPKVKPIASIAGNDAAPTIFFDGAYAYGANNGVLQIEIAAGTLVPIEDKVRMRPVCAAHLRGSPAAMMQLRELIDKALAMAATPKPKPPSQQN
jgi:hypothetical protein